MIRDQKIYNSLVRDIYPSLFIPIFPNIIHYVFNIPGNLIFEQSVCNKINIIIP
jgi:hypothetical protein